jgi:S-adenosylmethionine:tRNA-ribosyltransferase-isomerase (queuine synthetase)
MKLSLQFDLPKEFLAEFPSESRDEARLMVDRKKNKRSNTRLSKMLLIILMMVMF